MKIPCQPLSLRLLQCMNQGNNIHKELFFFLNAIIQEMNYTKWPNDNTTDRAITNQNTTEGIKNKQLCLE